jgi:TRAP-type C4-dicarboxylate transport system permease small subunit
VNVLRGYEQTLRGMVHALTALAAAGVLTMMLVTCADILLRVVARPITGAMDIVRIAGAITIAAALPYTTAANGHVAVEFLFQKLGRRGRSGVGACARAGGLLLFAVLAWESTRRGGALFRSGEVTPTLEIPMFWVAYVVAFSCGITALVMLHHLVWPGREILES